MLRTRTNDTVEILKLEEGVNIKLETQNVSGTSNYSYIGLSYNSINKYDIILFEDAYYYKVNDGEYKAFAYDTLEVYWLELSDDGLTIVTQFPISSIEFENLVEVTPTDVRLVEDQGKLQLQLEHDSQVLSIDEGVNDLLGSKFGFGDNDTGSFLYSVYFTTSDGGVITGTLETLGRIVDLSTLSGQNVSQIPIEIDACDSRTLLCYNNGSELVFMSFIAPDTYVVSKTGVNPIIESGYFINKLTGERYDFEMEV